MKKQLAGRALYSPFETFGILVRALRALPSLKKAKEAGTLSFSFRERLMLAVTEVNGCAMCSYAHTQMALRAGLSDAEIAAMLAWEAHGIPSEELPAVLFAQHYADRRGKPDPETWQRIQSEYGKEQSLAILSAIQVIMMGNAYGILFGSLKGRIRRQKEEIDRRSSLPYEVLMLLLLLPYLSLGILVAFIASALHAPRF